MFKREDIVVPGHLSEEKIRILFVLGIIVQHAPCHFGLEAPQNWDSRDLFPQRDKHKSHDFPALATAKPSMVLSPINQSQHKWSGSTLGSILKQMTYLQTSFFNHRKKFQSFKNNFSPLKSAVANQFSKTTRWTHLSLVYLLFICI